MHINYYKELDEQSFCSNSKGKVDTSSRMYNGAGLKSNNAKIKESARRENWPPLNFDKDYFHTLPKATLTSSPSKNSPPLGGSNFSIVPSNRVEKIDPKSL